MSYIGDLHDRAQQYSDSYGLTGPVNGDADAFRHAYSSAEMARVAFLFWQSMNDFLWE